MLEPAFARTTERTVWAKVPFDGVARVEDPTDSEFGRSHVESDEARQVVGDEDREEPFEAFAVFDARVSLLALVGDGTLLVDGEPVAPTDDEFGEFVGPAWRKVAAWPLDDVPGEWANVANATQGGRNYGAGSHTQDAGFLALTDVEAENVREALFEERLKAPQATPADEAAAQARTDAPVIDSFEDDGLDDYRADTAAYTVTDAPPANVGDPAVGVAGLDDPTTVRDSDRRVAAQFDDAPDADDLADAVRYATMSYGTAARTAPDEDPFESDPEQFVLGADEWHHVEVSFDPSRGSPPEVRVDGERLPPNAHEPVEFEVEFTLDDEADRDLLERLFSGS